MSSVWKALVVVSHLAALATGGAMPTALLSLLGDQQPGRGDEIGRQLGRRVSLGLRPGPGLNLLHRGEARLATGPLVQGRDEQRAVPTAQRRAQLVVDHAQAVLDRPRPVVRAFGHAIQRPPDHVVKRVAHTPIDLDRRVGVVVDRVGDEVVGDPVGPVDVLQGAVRVTSPRYSARN